MPLGHRHRVRVGMTTGMAGLGRLVLPDGDGHGAGLMLVPVMIPLCLAGAPGAALTAAGSLPVALAAIGMHTAGHAAGDAVRRRRGLPSGLGWRFCAAAGSMST